MRWGQFIVSPVLHTKGSIVSWLFELFQLLNTAFLLKIHVAAVVYTPEETSIISTLVHDDGMFLDTPQNVW